MEEKLTENEILLAKECITLAKEAGAVYHVKRVVLVNTEKVDQYLEHFCDTP